MPVGNEYILQTSVLLRLPYQISDHGYENHRYNFRINFNSNHWSDVGTFITEDAVVTEVMPKKVSLDFNLYSPYSS